MKTWHRELQDEEDIEKYVTTKRLERQQDTEEQHREPPEEAAPLTIGKTCATCAYGHFTLGKRGYIGTTIRRQDGVCIVGCPGPLPQNPEDHNTWHFPDPYEQNGRLLTKKEYLKKRESFLKGMPSHLRLNTMADAEVFYEVSVEWHSWWKQHFAQARLCNRITTCAEWQPGPKRRNSYVKSVISGKRNLSTHKTALKI